jgi:phosphoadenosine phosphosulfate reductase
MALWRDGAFAEDDWRRLADDAAPGGARVLVSLARWRRESEALRAGEVGVEIAAGAGAQGALSELADRPLIALNFDKFGDGRAFSYAILLRERHGFRGELRAVGDVLLDEIPLMIRCGFTAFEVNNEATLKALGEGRLPKFPLAYQPGLSKGESRDPSRPWARRLAGQ